MKKIKYFSMFSGIGGFELGLQNSKYKFENIGYSEIDKYAESIYKRNFPNHIGYGDATKIRTEDLPDFDFLVGGFPCQAFSNAGKKLGFNDTRGTLFFEIVRILKDKRPRYFLLENVRGLLHHENGKTFQTILEVLASLGYNVQWEIFNSKEFVPQRRERIFIKGYFGRECGREVLSFRKASKKVDSRVDEREIKKVGNYSPSNHYGKNVYSPNGIAPTLCANSIVKNGLNIMEENVNPYFSQVSDEKYCTTTKNNDCYAITTRFRNSPLNKRQDNYVLEKKHLKIRETTNKGYKEAYPYDGVLLNRGNRKIAKGIVRKGHCGALQTSGIWGTITNEYNLRKLTPLECERLQGFPDNWTEYGVNGEMISDTQRYKCVGNAVTVPVITFIINEMFSDLI